MPDLSDPLGPPKIVTGPEYLDALSRLGYNVENMASPLPIMSSIAQSGTNLLNSVYNQNLKMQQDQATTQEAIARAKSLDSVTQYNQATLDSRIKEAKANADRLALEAEVYSANKDNLIEQNNLKTQQDREFTRHQAQQNQLDEKKLSIENQKAQQNFDQSSVQHDNSMAALAEWKTAQAELPDALAPDFNDQIAKWWNRHPKLHDPATEQIVQDTVSRLQATNNLQTASITRHSMLNQYAKDQEDNFTDRTIVPEQKLTQDANGFYNDMVRANIKRVLNDLRSQYNQIPQGLSGTVGMQFEDNRRRIGTMMDQLNAYLGDDNEIANIRKGGNGNLLPSGLAAGDIAGVQALNQNMLTQWFKREMPPAATTELQFPAFPYVKGEREPPMITLKNVPVDQVGDTLRRSIPWMFDAQGNPVFDMQRNPDGSLKVMPRGGGPAISPQEAKERRAAANQAIQLDPTLKPLADAFARGEMSRPQYEEQVRAHWSGQRPGIRGTQPGTDAEILARPEVVNSPLFQQIRADALSGADPLYDDKGRVVKPGTPEGDAALVKKLRTEGVIAGMSLGGLVGYQGGGIVNPELTHKGGYPVGKEFKGAISDEPGRLEANALWNINESRWLEWQLQVLNRINLHYQSPDYDTRMNAVQASFALKDLYKYRDELKTNWEKNPFDPEQSATLDQMRKGINDSIGIIHEPFPAMPVSRTLPSDVSKSYQEGGPVTSPLTLGSTDTVAAALTPGEFVISAPAVEAIGVDKLSALNQAGSSQEPGQYVPPPLEIGSVPVPQNTLGGPNVGQAMNRLFGQPSGESKPAAVPQGATQPLSSVDRAIAAARARATSGQTEPLNAPETQQPKLFLNPATGSYEPIQTGQPPQTGQVTSTAGMTTVRGTEFGEVDNPARGGYTEAGWNRGRWGADISGKSGPPMVALPQSVLRKYGNPNASNFATNFNSKYVVKVVNPKTGRMVNASLGDAGPGEKTGAGIDLTWSTREGLGLPEDSSYPISYQIVPKT